jgi:hypothetical protein
VLSAVGVKAAGHRMKILKAAAELAAQSVYVEAIVALELASGSPADGGVLRPGRFSRAR